MQPLLRQRGRRRAARPSSRRTPWLGLSAFWATVVKVELTDIVFAVDSILVAVAMSTKIWVIITGGDPRHHHDAAGDRPAATLVRRYPALVDGAFVIIAWVGIKLLIEYLHAAGYIHFEVNKWLSFGLIAVIFLVVVLYARPQGPRPTMRTTTPRTRLTELFQKLSRPGGGRPPCR